MSVQRHRSQDGHNTTQSWSLVWYLQQMKILIQEYRSLSRHGTVTAQSCEIHSKQNFMISWISILLQTYRFFFYGDSCSSSITWGIGIQTKPFFNHCNDLLAIKSTSMRPLWLTWISWPCFLKIIINFCSSCGTTARTAVFTRVTLSVT